MVNRIPEKQILSSESELSGWRAQVLEAASGMGFPQPVCKGIASAVFEACANALHHGSKGSTGSISLCISMDDDRFEVVVEDPGSGFVEPPNISMPPATSRRGRGIPLMHYYMDEVKFETNDGFKVILTKYLAR